MTEGVLTYLEQARHIRQVGYRDQIPVDLPRESGVRFARPPDDGRALVAVLLRTGFTASPEGPAPAPYRLTETLLPADRTQFVINEGECRTGWPRQRRCESARAGHRQGY